MLLSKGGYVMWQYLSTPPHLINHTHNELCHYGVLGMKWGVRRSKKTLGQRITQARQDEKAYRDKLKKAVERYDRPSANIRSQSDVKRMKYRSQPLAVRVGTTAATTLAGKVFTDMMTGKIHKYGDMSRGQIIKELTKIAGKTATNVAINDALAKSASKNYDENGKIKKGVNTKRSMTKEDVMELGINMAVKTAPIAKWALQTKAYQVRREREMNEARFKSWGERIIPEKVGNIIELSEDDYHIY